MTQIHITKKSIFKTTIVAFVCQKMEFLDSEQSVCSGIIEETSVSIENYRLLNIKMEIFHKRIHPNGFKQSFKMLKSEK